MNFNIKHHYDTTTVFCPNNVCYALENVQNNNHAGTAINNDRWPQIHGTVQNHKEGICMSQ